MRKLKVQVDLETEKAKQKIKDMANCGESGTDGISTASDRLSRSLERTAKGVDSLGRESTTASSNMSQFVKGFTGLAVGMATSYASNFMPEGKGRNTVEMVGAGISGASSLGMLGAAFGPVGAVIGSLIGGIGGAAIKAEEQQQAVDKYLESFDRSEKRYSSAQEFKAAIDGLTSVGTTADKLREKLDEARAMLAKYKEAETPIIENIKGFAKNSQFEKSGIQAETLGINRQRQSQLESIIKSMEKSIETMEKRSNIRESITSLDSLSRIGGGSAGSDYSRLQLEAQKETVSVLRSIDSKTSGGSLWQ